VNCRPDLRLERELWAQAYSRIAGVDEAGRGAWAGPVVAAAVVLPAYRDDIAHALASVQDSKLLTARRRERCYDLITAHAVTYGVGSASSREIDELGIVGATRLAMTRAVESLCPPPDCLIVDALRLPCLSLPQHVLPKADMRHLSVAAASVLAKVARDHWMVELGERLAGYGFEQHKGYGTRAHWAALRSLGPACYHRRSFAPVRAVLNGAHEPEGAPPKWSTWV